MAMLILNDLGVRHWARFTFAHAVSGREFWTEAIAACSQARGMNPQPKLAQKIETRLDLLQKRQ